MGFFASKPILAQRAPMGDMVARFRYSTRISFKLTAFLKSEPLLGDVQHRAQEYSRYAP